MKVRNPKRDPFSKVCNLIKTFNNSIILELGLSVPGLASFSLKPGFAVNYLGSKVKPGFRLEVNKLKARARSSLIFKCFDLTLNLLNKHYVSPCSPPFDDVIKWSQFS